MDIPHPSRSYYEEAKEAIQRAQSLRESCSACSTISYLGATAIVFWERLKTGDDNPWVTTNDARGFMRSHGFDEECERARFLRRCEKCANTPKYPWSIHLDIDRVANMIQHDPRCQEAWPLALMKETIQLTEADGIDVEWMRQQKLLYPVGYQSAASKMVENITKAAEIYLGSYGFDFGFQLKPCERCGLSSHNGLKGSPAYEHMRRAGCVKDKDDGRGFKLL